MSEMDPPDRINLTDPWAGLGFQGGQMFTPEGHHIEPCESLPSGKRCATMDSSVVYLREYVRIRRERSLDMGGPGAGADPSNVVHMARLRRCP